jgi:molybdopterin-guanine dinucleotide biosynthesis protein A
MQGFSQLEAVVGVVLTGGKSRRMGRDKAALRIAGEGLQERAVRLLSSITQEVLLAAGASPGGATAKEGLTRVSDAPGKGPAAGIVGASAARPGQSLLVLACDMPRVNVALLRSLTTMEGDWVVPRWRGCLEPLCALYRPPALQALAMRVAAGDYALQALGSVEGLRVRHLEGARLSSLGEPSSLFFNVNTPQDLAILRSGRKPDSAPG